jgi:hypothetical protein
LQIGSDDADVAIEQRLKDGLLIDACDLVAADQCLPREIRNRGAPQRRNQRAPLTGDVGGGPKPATHHAPKPTG